MINQQRTLPSLVFIPSFIQAAGSKLKLSLNNPNIDALCSLGPSLTFIQHEDSQGLQTLYLSINFLIVLDKKTMNTKWALASSYRSTSPSLFFPSILQAQDRHQTSEVLYIQNKNRHLQIIKSEAMSSLQQEGDSSVADACSTWPAAAAFCWPDQLHQFLQHFSCPPQQSCGERCVYLVPAHWRSLFLLN